MLTYLGPKEVDAAIGSLGAKMLPKLYRLWERRMRNIMARFQPQSLYRFCDRVEFISGEFDIGRGRIS